MSNDWKKELDEKLRKKREVEDEAWERKRKVEDEAREKKWKKEQKKAKEKRQKMLKQHKRKFRCHINGCSRVSDGPGKEEYRESVEHTSIHEFYQHYTTYETRTRENWNKPTGLRKCDRCNRWTCLNHLHNGICESCAEKILKPGLFKRLWS